MPAAGEEDEDGEDDGDSEAGTGSSDDEQLVGDVDPAMILAASEGGEDVPLERFVRW